MEGRSKKVRDRERETERSGLRKTEKQRWLPPTLPLFDREVN